MIGRLNELDGDAAEAALLACCGSRAWAAAVARSRPFADAAALFVTADRIWWNLAPSDWLEAFRAHPRIGETAPAEASLKTRPTPEAGLKTRPTTESDEVAKTAAGWASRPVDESLQTDVGRVFRPADEGRWSAQEQSGVRTADDTTRAALASANREYERRFGHIFLVCATGKSADEMLGLLRVRLDNDPDTELRIAAHEQRTITRLRLEEFLAGQ